MSENIEEKEVEFTDDLFDSMLYGTFKEEEAAEEEVVEDEGVEEDDADDAEDFVDDNNEDQEDTDLEGDDEEEDTGDLDDGEDNEELDNEEADEEEDSLVEDDDSDGEDDDIEDEEEDADAAEKSEEDDIDEEPEEGTDTEEQSDGDAPDTDTVDYKAFYDAVVNTEFVVNGKKVKGFTDPQKIIQSQQMAGGFSEKMAGFKQYRPFMSPLKERGMLEDQAKFDLAMNLIDGDKEAIKTHLQSLGVDPLDLDMEKIDYSGKTNTASPESLVIEDTMERARGAGIEDRVRQVIGNEWDADSFQEFVSNPEVRNDLLSHMETGVYGAVQDKIGEMSRLDYNGTFGGMSTIAKYRAAVVELQKEAPTAPAAAQETVIKKAPARKPAAKKTSVKAEKAKIEKARQEEEYKEKAAKREAKVAKQRNRAASMSKKKPKAKPKAKFDPMKLEGEEFEAHMDFLISGGRG